MNAPVTLLPAPCAGAPSTCAANATVDELEQLYSAMSGLTWADHPRTARFMRAGLRTLSQKVVEEVSEVALEVVRKRTETTIRESADLRCHLVILWNYLEIQPADVWAEVRHRAEIVGIAEKLPKRHGRVTATP